MFSGSNGHALLVALTGIALGGVLTPPVALLVAPVVAGPATVDGRVAAVGVALLGGLGTAIAALDADSPERVGAGGTPVVLVGVPALYGVVVLAAGLAGEAAAPTFPFVVGTVAGLPAGVGAVRIGAALVARRAREASEDCTEWRARDADRPGWWVRLLGLGGGVAGVVLGVVLAAGDDLVAGAATALVGVVGTWAVHATGRRRSYAALDRGLVRDRRLHPWTGFEAYEVTEEAVVVHARRGWRPTVRVDRTDLEDERAVVAALARHLPDRSEGENGARPARTESRHR